MTTKKAAFNELYYFFPPISYVRNKAHPEASMANSFLADEYMVFCSRYLKGSSTKHNKPSRNDEN
jgi:hypothetical protein